LAGGSGAKLDLDPEVNKQILIDLSEVGDEPSIFPEQSRFTVNPL